MKRIAVAPPSVIRQAYFTGLLAILIRPTQKMKSLKRFQQLIRKFGLLWKRLSLLGLSDKRTAFQEKKTIWLNQVAMVCILCNIVLFPLYLLIQDLTAISSLIFLSLLETVPLLLNYRQKFKAARVYAAIVGPLILVFVILLYGKESNLDLGFSIVILMVFIFFEKKWERLLFILFTIVCYLFSDLYVSEYGSFSPTPPRDFDRYIVFFSVSAVIALIIHAFILENKKIIAGNEALLKRYQEKNQDLERFTYIASHDLKTPLRTIVSFLGLMERDYQKGDTKNYQEHLNFVKSAARQMYFLISDILEYSKVNNSNEKKAWVDLNKVLEKVQHNLADLVQSKQAQIIAPQLPFMWCNETQLLVVFQNIIENGIKYNESPKPILQIYFKQNTETATLIFQDNGIGIEAQYYTQIFEMFKRLHTVDEYQGTGIGLAICKKIVEHYEGRIYIQPGQNEGTQFMIDFPSAIVRSLPTEKNVLAEV